MAENRYICDMKLTPEEKLLRIVIKNICGDRNYPLKQEVPVCPKCRLTVDIMDPLVRVEFKEEEIKGRTFVFAEPYCPTCSTKTEALIYINN